MLRLLPWPTILPGVVVSRADKVLPGGEGGRGDSPEESTLDDYE